LKNNKVNNVFNVKMNRSKLVSTRRSTVLSLPSWVRIPCTHTHSLVVDDGIMMKDRVGHINIPGNTKWGGRLNTVDLLIKVACFVKNVNNIFNIKRSWLKQVCSRRSTVLILSRLVRFPWTCHSNGAAHFLNYHLSKRAELKSYTNFKH
jgi:hypothetical protein